MSSTSSLPRESLKRFASEMFKIVSKGATPEQWAEWLRVPLELAADADLFTLSPEALEKASADQSADLDGREIFGLVAMAATPEQWKEWLRVPLEHAAARGNLDLFNKLLGAGANGSAGWRGCDGRTLLHAAAIGGSADVVSALLGAGARPDVNVLYHERGHGWEVSALYLAAEGGHEDAARLLVKAGAPGREPGYEEGDEEEDYNLILLEAARHGCEQLVNDLLHAGVDPNPIDGLAPIHLAAGQNFEGIVSALLARGADKNPSDDDGNPPLVSATKEGCTAVVNILLDAGADVKMLGEGNNTALEWAAMCGHVDTMKAILGHKFGVNAADEGGAAAIRVAAEHGEVGAIDALVEAGANIEGKDAHGRTPLCLAAFRCQSEAMRSLLRHGADARIQDNDGNSLLHLVRYGDFGGAVEFLLRSGADETALNNHGKTPAQVLESIPSSYFRSSEVLERARLLLNRAPNDRAWRRRCWLVVLRSRALKASLASRDAGGGSSFVGGRVDGGGSKTARIGNAGGGEKDGNLRVLVLSLVGLELEGVFRKVVGFL